MEMFLNRDPSQHGATISNFYLDRDDLVPPVRWYCFMLEDEIRSPGVKVYGETAIPPGRYRVLITLSSRFKRYLPLLVGVPGFDGIRIHPGNTAADTKGCLLPGFTRDEDSIRRSRDAFDAMMNHLATISGHDQWGPVWELREDTFITVTNPAAPAAFVSPDLTV